MIPLSPNPCDHTSTTHWDLPQVDIFRSLVDSLDGCTVKLQSSVSVCVCACVCERVKARECDHAFISHAVADSV